MFLFYYFLIALMKFEQKDGSDVDCVAKEKDGSASGISVSTNAIKVLEALVVLV